MRYAGLIMLVVGVAVSAAYGARLSPPMREQMVLRGEAHVLHAQTGAANAAYCAALVAQLEAHDARVREVAAADECELPPEGGEDEGAEEERSGPNVEAICAARAAAGESFDAIVAEASARVEAKRGTDVSDLGDDVAEKRVAWLAAMEAEVEPAARAAVLQPVAPEARLTTWASDSGPFFGIGLLLVVIGAVMGRVSAKRAAADPAASRSASGGDDAPARDLGEMLAEIQSAIAELADEAAANEHPNTDDYERVKKRIHELTLGAMEQVVESTGRVQSRYGMAAFADIFGPFASGERYLNRAWSALVDRHWEEAASSLERSAADLAKAQRALRDAAAAA